MASVHVTKLNSTRPVSRSQIAFTGYLNAARGQRRLMRRNHSVACSCSCSSSSSEVSMMGGDEMANCNWTKATVGCLPIHQLFLVWGTSCRLLTKGQASPLHKGPDSKGDLQWWVPTKVPCYASTVLIKKETKSASSPDWWDPAHHLPWTFDSSVTALHRLTWRVGIPEHLILLRNGHLIWASRYEMLRRMCGMYYV